MARTAACRATILVMIAGQVWHYWLGLGLLIASVGAVAQGVIGYVAKVSATKYPNRRQRRIQAKK